MQRPAGIRLRRGGAFALSHSPCLSGCARAEPRRVQIKSSAFYAFLLLHGHGGRLLLHRCVAAGNCTRKSSRKRWSCHARQWMRAKLSSQSDLTIRTCGY